MIEIRSLSLHSSALVAKVTANLTNHLPDGRNRPSTSSPRRAESRAQEMQAKAAAAGSRTSNEFEEVSEVKAGADSYVRRHGLTSVLMGSRA